MKMKIMAVAAAVITSFAISTSNAQTETMNSDITMESAIKKNVVVNDKVQSNFQKGFPNAENINWVANKGVYEARFLNNGITMEVGYNKAGRVNYYVQHYTADKLSATITTEINNAYKEYDIMGVTEVCSKGQVGYLINIQSKKFSKIIRINNDDMDVYKNVALSF